MDPEDIGGIRLDDIFTGFGNILLTICILMILANILLLLSSTTKQPYISLPWIIANFIIGFILLVTLQKICNYVFYLDISLLQGLELFYFPILDMSYDEYVTIMVSNAVFIIITAFFWIVVVFMFQININRDPSQTDPTETLGTWMRKKFKNKL